MGSQRFGELIRGSILDVQTNCQSARNNALRATLEKLREPNDKNYDDRKIGAGPAGTKPAPWKSQDAKVEIMSCRSPSCETSSVQANLFSLSPLCSVLRSKPLRSFQ
jgi:hypothetical protein